MKPSKLITLTLAGTSLLGVAGAVAIPGLADSRSSLPLPDLGQDPSSSTSALESAAPPQLIAALPSTDRLWVKVRSEVAIEQLASQLSLDESRLARLNDVNEDHAFKPGDWLVLPSQSSRQAKQLAAIDTSELRRTPPLQAPPTPVAEESTRVRSRETLVDLANRTNRTIAELLRLNPGLEAARLVVGTQIRLAQSSPGRSRMVLGLSPTTSGGLSWPELPNFGGDPQQPNTDPNRPFSSGMIWPTQGVFSSGYGWRWGRMHKGIDVANNVGTPIVAVQAGQVQSSGWHDGGYGYLVEIRHPDGTLTRYAHNSRLAVRAGDVVAQGQVISYMGSTGRSTGPHLHFEVHPPGRGAVNPLQFLPGRA